MVQKLSELRSRAPEQGRIRYGIKTEKAMKAIDTWRFTSPDRDAIEHLAGQYGGDARPWHDPKASPNDQWEVITQANSIAVWLPEDALSVQYELWGGKGNERRCDGAVCRLVGEREPVPCVCEATGRELCKPYSRVQLILPTVGFGGTWRLEVKGHNFLYEAPGMIEAISQLQAHGLKRVNLFLSKRTTRDQTGRHDFIVPQFSLSESPQQIVEGLAQVRSIGSPTHGALALNPAEDVVDAEVMDPVWHQSHSNDEVVDAVIVGDEPIEPEGWDKPPPNIKVKRNPNPDGPRWVRST